jgi:hypothetical protein
MELVKGLDNCWQRIAEPDKTVAAEAGHGDDAVVDANLGVFGRDYDEDAGLLLSHR